MISGRTGIDRQLGFGTLVMSFVLLIVAVLIVYYSAATAINEQRLAANQVRTKQAFAAAQAGLDHALDYMKYGGIDRNNDGVADTITNLTLGTTNGPAKYRVSYCDTGSTPPPCPTTPAALTCTAPSSLTRVLVFSCGWSDDDSAIQKVTQVISGTPGTPSGGTPPVPLISLGTANLLVGGASILNYFNDLTSWSGATFLGQSNTGKTFVRDTSTNPTPSPTFDYRNVGNSPGCNNPPSGYVCSTQGSDIGHDVIEGDPNLASLTSDALFQASFGTTKANYRDYVAAWRVDLTGTLANPNSTNVSSLNGKSDMALWVQGNASIDGTIGTATKPVILIVDGNLSLGANAVINGLVFVSGNLSANGTPTVYGSITVGGSANTTGNMKVVFDPFPSKGSNPYATIGAPTRVPGSWKDW